jgi:hypothetical protein
MKKELVWAIITGFGLGLTITYSVWSAKKVSEPITEKPQEKIEVAPTPTSVPIFLEIQTPENESIIDQDTIELSGKTDPQAVLAIFYEEGELIIEADENGQFKTDLELIEGANEITVFAFDEDGNEASQSMTLVYSTAEL